MLNLNELIKVLTDNEQAELFTYLLEQHGNINNEITHRYNKVNLENLTADTESQIKREITTLLNFGEILRIAESTILKERKNRKNGR